MNKVICQFCDKNISNCRYRKIIGVGERYACSYCLSNCACYYHLDEDGFITEYQFNYEGYSFLINFIKKTFRMFSSNETSIKDLFVLDFIPDITPRNIKEKLPTLLTFL